MHVFGEFHFGLGQGIPINRHNLHWFTSSHSPLTRHNTQCVYKELFGSLQGQGLCESLQADDVSHPLSTKSLPSLRESIAIALPQQAPNRSCAAVEQLSARAELYCR